MLPALTFASKNSCESSNLEKILSSFKSGKNSQAIKVLQKCKKLKCQELSDTIKSYSVDRWHYSMLNDQNRNSAFYHWLKNSIKPNDFVLDIGAGKVTSVGFTVLEM